MFHIVNGSTCLKKCITNNKPKIVVLTKVSNLTEINIGNSDPIINQIIFLIIIHSMKEHYSSSKVNLSINSNVFIQRFAYFTNLETLYPSSFDTEILLDQEIQ